LAFDEPPLSPPTIGGFAGRLQFVEFSLGDEVQLNLLKTISYPELINWVQFTFFEEGKGFKYLFIPGWSFKTVSLCPQESWKGCPHD